MDICGKSPVLLPAWLRPRQEARRCPGGGTHLSYLPACYVPVPHPRGVRHRRRSAMELATFTGRTRSSVPRATGTKTQKLHKALVSRSFCVWPGTAPGSPAPRVAAPSRGSATALHMRAGIACSHTSLCLPAFGVEKTASVNSRCS